MNAFKFSILPLLVIFSSLASFAVTDKEMEQARTITAKLYLRYANDGSGYLDDVKANTMAELNAALKAKEKENIKAFNAIKTPTDYASWDKTKLVEYWSATFFTSPGLTDKGKIARSRVRKQISAMTISAPTPTVETPTPVAETPADNTTETVPASTDTVTLDPTIVNAETDILADQKAMEEDLKKNPSLEPEHSYTWVYVAILVVLIGVVIWLVTYAAKVMKHQNQLNEDDNDEHYLTDEETAKIIANKDAEIKKLSQRLNDEQERSVDTDRDTERLKVENQRMSHQLEALRTENANLLDTVNDLKQRLKAAEKSILNSSKTQPAAESVVNKHAQPAAAKPDNEILKVIYLGRANARGIFVRADRKISVGNTIYRLDTNDGLVGTFTVVSIPAVTSIAIAEPEKMLSGGSTCDDFADALGASQIITESAGTAIFENGYWKVLRKARIHFE